MPTLSTLSPASSAVSSVRSRTKDDYTLSARSPSRCSQSVQDNFHPLYPPQSILVSWKGELLLLDAWDTHGKGLRTPPSLIYEAWVHFSLDRQPGLRVEDFRLAISERIDGKPCLFYLGLSSLRFIENGRCLELTNVKELRTAPSPPAMDEFDGPCIPADDRPPSRSSSSSTLSAGSAGRTPVLGTQPARPSLRAHLSASAAEHKKSRSISSLDLDSDYQEHTLSDFMTAKSCSPFDDDDGLDESLKRRSRSSSIVGPAKQSHLSLLEEHVRASFSRPSSRASNSSIGSRSCREKSRSSSSSVSGHALAFPSLPEPKRGLDDSDVWLGGDGAEQVRSLLQHSHSLSPLPRPALSHRSSSSSATASAASSRRASLHLLHQQHPHSFAYGQGQLYGLRSPASERFVEI